MAAALGALALSCEEEGGVTQRGLRKVFAAYDMRDVLHFFVEFYNTFRADGRPRAHAKLAAGGPLDAAIARNTERLSSLKRQERAAAINQFKGWKRRETTIKRLPDTSEPTESSDYNDKIIKYAKEDSAGNTIDVTVGANTCAASLSRKGCRAKATETGKSRCMWSPDYAYLANTDAIATDSESVKAYKAFPAIFPANKYQKCVDRPTTVSYREATDADVQYSTARLFMEGDDASVITSSGQLTGYTKPVTRKDRASGAINNTIFGVKSKTGVSKGDLIPVLNYRRPVDEKPNASLIWASQAEKEALENIEKLLHKMPIPFKRKLLKYTNKFKAVRQKYSVLTNGDLDAADRMSATAGQRTPNLAKAIAHVMRMHLREATLETMMNATELQALLKVALRVSMERNYAIIHEIRDDSSWDIMALYQTVRSTASDDTRGNTLYTLTEYPPDKKALSELASGDPILSAVAVNIAGQTDNVFWKGNWADYEDHLKEEELLKGLQEHEKAFLSRKTDKWNAMPLRIFREGDAERTWTSRSGYSYKTYNSKEYIEKWKEYESSVKVIDERIPSSKDYEERADLMKAYMLLNCDYIGSLIQMVMRKTTCRHKYMDAVSSVIVVGSDESIGYKLDTDLEDPFIKVSKITKLGDGHHVCKTTINPVIQVLRESKTAVASAYLKVMNDMFKKGDRNTQNAFSPPECPLSRIAIAFLDKMQSSSDKNIKAIVHSSFGYRQHLEPLREIKTMVNLRAYLRVFTDVTRDTFDAAAVERDRTFQYMAVWCMFALCPITGLWKGSSMEEIEARFKAYRRLFLFRDTGGVGSYAGLEYLNSDEIDQLLAPPDEKRKHGPKLNTKPELVNGVVSDYLGVDPAEVNGITDPDEKTFQYARDEKGIETNHVFYFPVRSQIASWLRGENSQREHDTTRCIATFKLACHWASCLVKSCERSYDASEGILNLIDWVQECESDINICLGSDDIECHTVDVGPTMFQHLNDYLKDSILARGDWADYPLYPLYETYVTSMIVNRIMYTEPIPERHSDADGVSNYNALKYGRLLNVILLGNRTSGDKIPKGHDSLQSRIDTICIQLMRYSYCRKNVEGGRFPAVTIDRIGKQLIQLIEQEGVGGVEKNEMEEAHEWFKEMYRGLATASRGKELDKMCKDYWGGKDKAMLRGYLSGASLGKRVATIIQKMNVPDDEQLFYQSEVLDKHAWRSVRGVSEQDDQPWEDWLEGLWPDEEGYRWRASSTMPALIVSDRCMYGIWDIVSNSEVFALIAKNALDNFKVAGGGPSEWFQFLHNAMGIPTGDHVPPDALLRFVSDRAEQTCRVLALSMVPGVMDQFGGTAQTPGEEFFEPIRKQFTDPDFLIYESHVKYWWEYAWT